MPLEPSFGNIDDLNPDWPLGTDPLAEGYDHIRGVKLSLQGNVTGDAAQTRLLADALIALLTADDGIRVKATNPVQANTLIRMQDNADVRVADLLVNAAGLLRVVVATVGQAMELRGSAAAPNDETMAAFVPGGEASLNFAGEARLETKTAGVNFPGRTYDMGQQTDNSIILRLINLIGGLRIIVSSTSGDPGFNQVDAAGTFEQTWINLFRDGAVQLNYDGSQRWATSPDGVLLNGTISWTTGSGSPEGVVTANPGSIYSDGVSGSALPLWTKNFSNGNTGWVSCDVSAP